MKPTLQDECWFNVYANGCKGMLHSTREDAEVAGTPSYAERLSNGAIYRLHVRMKEALTPTNGGEK